LLFLTLACIVCLLPFINKAFHTDDPLFIWSAKQIQAHPLDPFGFQVAWITTTKPMYKETKNPPLACYYLALAGTLFGWTEPSLHLALLVPAVAVVWGTFRLAKHYGCHPTLAALVTLTMPVFLLCSSTLMCDTIMLAFWVWALVFWEEGLAAKRMALLCLAGLLIGLAALTKYFAISLVPLLLVYSVAREKKIGASMIALAIPVGINDQLLGILLFAIRSEPWTGGKPLRQRWPRFPGKELSNRPGSGVLNLPGVFRRLSCDRAVFPPTFVELADSHPVPGPATGSGSTALLSKDNRPVQAGGRRACSNRLDSSVCML
jgi:4-amino-4-deoxy-L-arabinose transferase-like glycosyltransferase